MPSFPKPVENVIAKIGSSVTGAQRMVDAQAVDAVRKAYGAAIPSALQRLGLAPADDPGPIDSEVVLTTAMNETVESDGSVHVGVSAASVDVTSMVKYDFDLRASTRMSFKVVPLPPTTSAVVRVVPDLSGLTYGKAKALLDGLGFEWEYGHETELMDDTAVSSQSPEAGAFVGRDAVVVMG